MPEFGADKAQTADTELPAAAALADNTANPTTTGAAAYNMVYDGSTWDRALGNSTDGTLVNLGTNNDVTVTGDALTALQLIDDAIFTDDAAFTPATSKLMAIGMQADETSTDSVDEGDIGTPRMTLDRRVRVASKATDGPGEPVIDSYATVAINLTTGADQVLVASAANKQVWVYGYAFTVGDADGQTVSLQDEDNTALTGIMEFSRYGGISVAPSGNFAMPVFKCATDKDLEIDITGGDVDGWLSYAIVSV